MNLRSVISAGGIVAVGMLAGRLLGLLREVTIATYFGASGQADAAIFLLLVPDFITNVFIASAGSAALIPAFAARTPQRAIVLFWQTLCVSMLVFIVLGLVVFSQHGWIAGLFASDNAVPNLQNALFFTLLSLPFMAATWVFTAWLQYRGRFVAPAFANALFNSVLLCTLWFAPTGILVLAIGSFVATLLRLAAHVFAFMRAGERLRQAASLVKQNCEINRDFATAYLQTALTGILEMLPLYAPYFIVAVGAGGLALFNYAFKLALLCAGLLQTVIQTVILPLFVRHHNRNEPHLREKMYSLSLHLGFVFGVSIALAVSLAAEPIAALCFGHGKMSAENVSEIASLLRLGVWSTPFAVLSCLWQQMLYAGHRAKSAMMVSLIVTASLLPLYWLGLTMQGAYGVMIAYLVIRMLHLAVIVKLGKPGAVSAALLPGREYPLSAGAMLGVFAVLAWLYKACLPGFSDNAKVLAAMVIGGAVLAAGLWAHKEIRHMLRFKTVEFEV